jgi:hypothetical protein
MVGDGRETTTRKAVKGGIETSYAASTEIRRKGYVDSEMSKSH